MLSLLLLCFPLVESLRFMHIGDIRYDQYYAEGTPNNCVQRAHFGYGCCHSFKYVVEPYDLSGTYGNRYCDTPMKYIDSLVDWVITYGHGYVDFVIVSGSWLQRDKQMSSSRDEKEAFCRLTKKIREINFAPIIPTIGRDDLDILDANYVASVWSEWLQDDNITGNMQTFVDMNGWYSRVISNTLIMVISDNDKNKHMAASMFAHLAAGVNYAKKNNLSVLITGQDAPGTESVHIAESMQQLANLYDDINQVWVGNSTIILYTDENTVRGVGYMTHPVQSSTHFPSARVYSIKDKIIDDYEQFYTDLSLMNKGVTVSTESEYKPMDKYKLSSLSVDEWNAYVDKLENDRYEFYRWFKIQHKGYDTPTCDEDCRRDIICSMRYRLPSLRKICNEQIRRDEL